MKRIAVIFALFWELWPLARKLGIPFLKTINRQIIVKNQNIVLIRCGMGKEKAMRATERVIDEFHPEIIVSAGFCGALVEDLKVGDIVTSDFSDGKIFCSRRPLASYDDKTAAHQQHKAIVVDMESEGVAAVARKHGIDFVAVKAVSDGLKDDIPIPSIRLASPSRLIRLKHSAGVASERLSEFLFDYINKGDRL